MVSSREKPGSFRFVDVAGLMPPRAKMALPPLPSRAKMALPPLPSGSLSLLGNSATEHKKSKPDSKTEIQSLFNPASLG